MGQDSLNLQYGTRHASRKLRGQSVDMHPDEGYGGPKMVPGYSGTYKNSKAKVIGLKANGNPKSYGSEKAKTGVKYGNESGVMRPSTKKKRK